jgi:putative ABC transport system permease protein
MANLWRDARLGLRALRRHPGFTSVAVLTLALGIAANAAIFSVVYATFIAPLPYREADRLVMVWSYYREERGPTSAADFAEWRRQSAAVFEDLNAFGWRSVNVATRHRPEHLEAGPVTPGYLPMLGYGHPLALGRDFLDEEAIPGRDHAVILTHRLWSERFGADPRIVGQTIRLDGKPHVVVGVLGEGPADLNQNQLWLPMAFTPEQLDDRTSTLYLNVMGRLRPGLTVARANAHMASVNQRLAELHPGSSTDRTIRVEPFRNDFLGEGTKRALWLLLGAVGFVLLIACANVANLLLARGTARGRELGLRAALGASRAEIFRQLVVESLVLAAIGGALGVGLATLLVRVVVALMPPFLLPTEADVRLNLPVLLFSLLACLASGVLSGCVPAWQAARADVGAALKQAGPSLKASGGWLRQALVVVEFALALTLLTGGGLALHSFLALTRVDLGLRPENLLTFSLPRPEEEAVPAERIRVFYDRLLDRVQAIPGVLSAALSTCMPLRPSGFGTPFTVVGRPSSRDVARLNVVTPPYFGTLGIRVVRGRAFTERDTAGAPRVAMVSATFARRFLPIVDPLGERLLMPEVNPGVRSATAGREYEVVGVFGDVRYQSPGSDPLPEIAVPFAQSAWPTAFVAVRTSGNPAAVRRSIEAVVRSLDPDVPLADVKTMRQRVSESLANDRFNSLLFGSFGAVALLLAALGIYGVMSFAIAQRTREIGLRMALGAERGRLLRDVLRQGTMTALAGCVAGSAGAWLAVRSLRGIVHGVGDLEPGPFVAVVLTLVTVALLACLVPALRAASVQPMAALRHE